MVMHEHETIEQAFLRFRRDGDPAALAAVFDRTAPRLLLVAAHVTPDPSAAEDLVQDTFLQAMERAGQWRADRELLPWLATILRHRAIDLARRLRLRRPADAPWQLVEAASREEGPGERTETDELLQRVDAALAELASPFREALVLRLVHGMEPTAIAHALGRKPSTVRVQLKRGLERLRAALPAGVAGALAALLLPGRGIAAVRAAVLERAGASSAGAAAATGRGLWLLLGLSVASLGLLAWLLFGQRTGAPDRAGGGAAQRVEAQDPEAAGAAPTGTDGVDRRAAAPRTAPQPDGDPTTLRGRVVDALDARPIGAGRVVASFGRGRFVSDDPTFREWPEPVAAELRGDGTFELTIRTEPKMRVTLRVEAAGHAPASTSWVSVRAGLDLDLGDIAVARGAELSVRVVDADGAPVEGVRVGVHRTSEGVALDAITFDTWDYFVASSRADGTVPAGVVPAPGRYEVRAAYDEHAWQVTGPEQVDVQPGIARDVQVLVAPAEPRDGIAGRVVDEAGQPVAGVTLCLDAQLLDMGQATSEVDGTFRLAHRLPKRAYELHLPATDRRHRLLEPERTYETGTTDALVRVAVQPVFDVAVHVVRADSKAPVSAFGVRSELDYWRDEFAMSVPPERFYWPIAPEAHDGGRAVLPGLCPGHYRLNVHPADNDLATAYMVPFEVGPRGAEPVRVELAPLAPLLVRVVDERGVPKPRTKVRLVHLMATDGSWSSLFSVEELARGVGAGRKMAIALQTATTDGDGRVELRAPADEARLALVIGGVGALGTKRELEPVPVGGAERTVTMPTTATVRGRVGPAAFVAGIAPEQEVLQAHRVVRPEDSELVYRCPEVRLLGADGARGGEGPLLPDGTFEIADALPGDWRLVLDVEWRRDAGGYRVDDAELAEVPALRADEVRELDLDASRLLPARVRGVVTLAGVAWTDGRFGMLPSHGEQDRPERIPRTPTATFSAALAAGRYLPFVRFDEVQHGRDMQRVLFLDRRVELGAGREHEIGCGFERRALRIRVVDADGAPQPGLAVELRAVDFPEVHALVEPAARTDAHGVLLLDPAPPGRISVGLPRTDDAQARHVAEVSAGPASRTEVVVRLPR